MILFLIELDYEMGKIKASEDAMMQKRCLKIPVLRQAVLWKRETKVMMLVMLKYNASMGNMQTVHTAFLLLRP